MKTQHTSHEILIQADQFIRLMVNLSHLIKLSRGSVEVKIKGSGLAVSIEMIEHKTKLYKKITTGGLR